MHHHLLLIPGLLFVVMLLVLLARRLKIAYLIFLVIAGLGISFIPGVPELHLDPDLIFLVFLPPLLYEAAWYTSWNDFWKWKRPIALLAFGLVFFTSTIVAYAPSAFIPGFSLALGFLLGCIISPPDAVAAATVLKGMGVPKRLMTILEGESLVNDASSLIVFKFALAAVLTSTFSIQEASGQFFLVAGIGIVIGLAGAHVWTTLIFVMNALVFVLIGLELPEIVAGLGAYSVAHGIKYGVIASAITIALRFLWVYPAAHVPRLLSAKARQDPSTGQKGPLIISWAGMRGVVSLATALSIP